MLVAIAEKKTDGPFAEGGWLLSCRQMRAWLQKGQREYQESRQETLTAEVGVSVGGR